MTKHVKDNDVLAAELRRRGYVVAMLLNGRIPGVSTLGNEKYGVN